MYYEVIDKQIASAMKNGEHLKLSVWRSIKNEFLKFKTSGTKEELTDEKEISIIKKMAQQRKDSIEQYMKAGRESLAQAEQQELDVLNSLLPKEPTEEEIDAVIKEFVDSRQTPVSIKDLKSVMATVKMKYPTANGGMVTKLFRENYI